MKVLQVSVGLPRPVQYNGELISTGIFKEPVEGKVKVGEVNLDGDGQADHRVHGGFYKAVYVYPSEHYQFWRQELPEMVLPFGIFGENLTTEGLLESTVHVGDRFRIGTAEFAVTQPRQPCFKLGIRFGRNDILRRFANSGKSGFYLSILKMGEIEREDPVVLLSRDANQRTIADLVSSAN